ncbi:MAG: hypothetical protein K1X86_14400 [Ignavibacteria bacterium]|nr:hypothetical protein [Ignavibacteria bacterium]
MLSEQQTSSPYLGTPALVNARHISTASFGLPSSFINSENGTAVFVNPSSL